METYLFWSDRLDGPWNLPPKNPVSCSVRNCRSAGNLLPQKWKNVPPGTAEDTH
jgi:hypothetical protein